MTQTATSAIGWQNKYTSTLSASINASDTTIPLVSVPTPTEGFLVIEPDSSTAFECIYYTSKTGAAVICPSAAAGRGQDDSTAASHTSGASVRMDTTAGMFEVLQNGTGLGAASITNAKLATGAGEAGGAWTTYSPTITNFTLGNGAITTARYTQVGKTVKVSILVTLGSTSAMGTQPTITLPVTATNTYVADRHNFGVANLTDATTADIMGIIGYKSTTTVVLYAAQANSVYVQRINIDVSTPFTWTTNDRFSLEFEYEAA